MFYYYQFRALLSSTQPGQSLTLAARAVPSGPIAKKERADKLGHFIQTHCLSGMPGTHPFFQALYGIFRLQALPGKLGGADDSLIEWEVDDAVFLESAGKDFTIEAVAVLKGVSIILSRKAHSTLSLSHSRSSALRSGWGTSAASFPPPTA